MSISGYKTLYAVDYWAWDGSSREVDYVTGDVVESLLTDFIYAFWEDQDLLENFETVTGVKINKIDAIRTATDEEISAFEAGWRAREYKNNESYGHLD